MLNGELFICFILNVIGCCSLVGELSRFIYIVWLLLVMCRWNSSCLCVRLIVLGVLLGRVCLLMYGIRWCGLLCLVYVVRLFMCIFMV